MKMFAEVLECMFWVVFGFTPFAFLKLAKSSPGFIFSPLRFMFTSDD